MELNFLNYMEPVFEKASAYRHLSSLPRQLVLATFLLSLSKRLFSHYHLINGIPKFSYKENTFNRIVKIVTHITIFNCKIRNSLILGWFSIFQ